MLRSLSRSSSQNSLNEGERNASPGPIFRNIERPAIEPIENELDPIVIDSINFTKQHPVGAILFKLATDNTALARKTNLRGVETNINDLCTSFHTAIKLDKDQRLDEITRSHKQLETNLINKTLNSHQINSTVKPPTHFSDVDKLTSPSKLLEVQKLLPQGIKFSGSRLDSMSVVEFLNTLKTAQEQLQLSEAEFIKRMLICSTGHAHELISEWQANGENAATIYHCLLINFDKRLPPAEARHQLNNYKAPKSFTLAQTESHIMILAGRAASTLPEGPSRTANYNSEAINALIRALPATSSSLVCNEYHKLSADLERQCTFAELSKILNLYRTTIDNDIKNHGGEHTFKNRKVPQINRGRSKFTNYSIVTNNPRHLNNKQVNFSNYDQYAMNEARKLARAGALMSTAKAYNNTTSFTPRPIALNNLTKNTYSKDARLTNKNKNNPNRDPKGKFVKTKNTGCSLCGMHNHLAKECRNMQNDRGQKVEILPTYGTCMRCPLKVFPRLHHPEALCPFRVGGPLANKFKTT